MVLTDRAILIIGGGIAGLCAAIAARRLGAIVRVVESAPPALLGGNARHARNFRIAHAEPVWHTPGAYPEHEFLDELMKVGGGSADEVLARALVADSAQCAAWLTGCGVRLQAPGTGVLPYSRRTAFLLGGGQAMVNALHQTAARIGVGFTTEAEVVALAPTPDGGWAAEIAQGPARRRVEARAVVVASGGPGADPDWRRAHFGPVAEGVLIRGSRYSNGLMMQRLVESGARTVGDPSSCHMVAVDARGPACDGGIVTRITAIPHGLVVDRAARPVERAGAGADKSHYAQWGAKIAGCDGGLAFLILDAEGFARAPPAAFAPLRADTLEDLAGALDLDGAALKRAVEAFNQGHARPIVTPPFAAFPLRAGLTFVHYGLAVDAFLRVTRSNGDPFEGLFAAGMIMASNILPRGYLAGLGLTLSAVTGRRAGEAAARHALA